MDKNSPRDKSLRRGAIWQANYIYISSGGLVLTIGFIKDIVDINTASDKYLLLTSWICFSLAIVSSLTSHLFAVITSNYALKQKSKTSRRFNYLVYATNYGSWISLILAIIMFVIFVYNNIEING